MNEFSQILASLGPNDPRAAEQLLPLVYDELRKLAAQKLAQEKPGQTLQATALVHEAYLRLAGADGVRLWNGRAHFFRAAADAMRRILVDRARAKHSQKRGGGRRRVDLEVTAEVVHEPSQDVADISAALDRLAAHDSVKAEVVKLRYFAGLSVEEVADLLGISRATADRYWRYAKTWLYCELTRTSDPGA